MKVAAAVMVVLQASRRSGLCRWWWWCCVWRWDWLLFLFLSGLRLLDDDARQVWLDGRASAGWKLPLALALALAAACFLLVVSSNRQLDDGDS